eukprot:6374813-Amphidinium_carterae.2
MCSRFGLCLTCHPLASTFVLQLGCDQAQRLPMRQRIATSSDDRHGFTHPHHIMVKASCSMRRPLYEQESLLPGRSPTFRLGK